MSTVSVGLLVFFALLVLLILLCNYKFDILDTFRRMQRALFEGFENPGDSETPAGFLESDLAPAMATETEKLLTSPRLIPFTEQEAVRNWSRMTSEKCLKSDMGEALKPVRNFLQRTNNYVRSHPDSCSAPNHEFVGTFYQPHEGVGAVPASGLPYPPSTQCV